MPILVVILVVLLNLFFLTTAPWTLTILAPFLAVFLLAAPKKNAPDS